MEENQTVNGWCNWQTNEFYLCLTNDNPTLTDFRKCIIDHNLWTPRLIYTALSLGMSKADAYKVDFLSAIIEQSEYMLNDLGTIDRDMQNAIITHFKGSELINMHRELNKTKTKQPQPTPTPPKEKTTMRMKLETKYFVNDIEVTKLSLEDKTQLLIATEKHIEHLKSVKTPSKMVTAEVEKTDAFLGDITSLFDKLI